jgi:adenylate cyclase
LGRHKEAIAEMKRALELDPLSLAINTWFGAILFWAGENDEAIAQLQKAIEMDRNLPIAHLWLGRVYLEKKMFKEAIDEFKSAVTLFGGQSSYLASLGYGYAVSGQSNEAAKILTRLTQLSARKYVPAYEVAAPCARLGRKDQAFQWLQKTCEEGACSSKMGDVRSDPAFRYSAFRPPLRRLAAPSRVAAVKKPFFFATALPRQALMVRRAIMR